MEARGSKFAKERRAAASEIEAVAPSLPVVREYPPNLIPGAANYFEGIVEHLANLKRLRSAFTPAITIYANLLFQLDELTARIASGEADFRDNIRHKDLVGMVQRYQDRFFMNPASMEGVSIAKDPPKPVENEKAKAPIRRGL